MKRNTVFTVLFLYTTLLIAGCGEQETSSSDYMILDDVRYVNRFPQTFSLDNAIEVDADIIGMQSFHIIDSLLIFSTTDKDGLWSFVSLPDYRFMGKFITKGNGPYEFIFSPFAGQQYFFREEGKLFCDIYDSQKGKLYRMNMDESIRNGRLAIRTLNDSLPPFMFGFAVIDSATFLCREINGTQTQQTRFLLHDGQRTTSPLLEKLNRASIRHGEDFNILSASIKRNNSLIVEMPVYLNYINMYSPDGSFGRTVCVDRKLDNIGEIQNQSRKDRLFPFISLSLFSTFWGVVYVNEDTKTYLTERKKLPSILLFDWDGEPLAELRLNTHVTSFDIDFINGCLYTLDLYTDVFCKYDIRDILEKLGK
jgi:hypothetical protein